MSLWLVGLGPSPRLQDLSRRAEQALLRCTRVWLDAASAEADATRRAALSALLGRALEPEGVLDQRDRTRLIELARQHEVALAVAGDPLVATPYRHLCAQARAAGVVVELVPGVSVLSAAATLAGLDASQVEVVVVAKPDRPEPAELAQVQAALRQGRPVLLLAAGRAEVDDASWQALAERCGGSPQQVAIDGGGCTLVLRPGR